MNKIKIHSWLWLPDREIEFTCFCTYDFIENSSKKVSEAFELNDIDYSTLVAVDFPNFLEYLESEEKKGAVFESFFKNKPKQTIKSLLFETCIDAFNDLDFDFVSENCRDYYFIDPDDEIDNPDNMTDSEFHSWANHDLIKKRF